MTLATLGPALAILAVLSLAGFLLRYRLKAEMFATLILLFPLAAGIVALSSGYLWLLTPFSALTTLPSQLVTTAGAELVAPATILIAVLAAGVWSLVRAEQNMSHPEF